MRCRKLRKIYPKYTDHELSEQERQLVEKHLQDCPDCAGEISSLEKMSSLLQTAAEVEVSDEYWNTYWDRLETKLPAGPAQVTLASRMSDFFAEMFRRPVILGQVTISVIFLAFLIYTASDHLTRTPSMPAQPPSITEDMEAKTSADLGAASRKNEEALSGGRGLDSSLRTEVYHEIAEPEAKLAEVPAERAAGETKLALGDKLYKGKEAEGGTTQQFSYAAPAKPESSPILLPKMAQARKDSAEVELDSDGIQNEYVLAEQHFQRGDYVQAIPAYQNFITANTKTNVQDDRTLKAGYQIGEAYYQLGDYKNALSNFAAVTDADKSDSYGLFGRESALKRNEKAKEIVAQSKPQLERKPRARGRTQVQPHRAVVESIAEPDGKALGRSLELADAPAGVADVETRAILISRAIFRQAQSYEHLKNGKDALAAYGKYIEKYPNGEYISQAKEKIAQNAAAARKAKPEAEKAGKAESEEKDK